MLGPRSVSVRERVRPAAADDHRLGQRGVLPANAETGVTRLSSGPLSVMDGAASDDVRLLRRAGGPHPARPGTARRVRPRRAGVLPVRGGAMPATERGCCWNDCVASVAWTCPPSCRRYRRRFGSWCSMRPTRAHPTGSGRSPSSSTDSRTSARNSSRPEGITDPLAAGPGRPARRPLRVPRRLGRGLDGRRHSRRRPQGRRRRSGYSRSPRTTTRRSGCTPKPRSSGRLQNDRIVTLNSEETVGGRPTLVLQYAGRTTLAEELAGKGGRLSIDLLERWGTDLLTALGRARTRRA